MHNSKLWVSVYLYYDKLDKLVHDVVVAVRNEVYEKKLTDKFIFNKSWLGGENIILIYEVANADDAVAIRRIIENRSNAFFALHPAPEKRIMLPVNDWFLPFPNNHVHFNERFQFDIMETGGLQASILAEPLLTTSSNTILDLIEATGENWDIDSALGIAIQFHLVFVLAFDNDLENVALFYDSFFNNLLKVTEGGDSDRFKKQLLDGLDANFDDQREALLGFTSFITGIIQQSLPFEDEWLNNWSMECRRFSEQLKALQAKGELIRPEQFVTDETITTPDHVQALWSIQEYYLRATNSQLGIENAYEMNLVYSLQKCMKLILTTTEA